MLLALDVGNTNITLGRVADGDVEQTWRLASRPAPTTDELEAWLDKLVGLDRVTEAVMASVVPVVGANLAGVFTRRGIPLLIADAETIPIPVRVDRPAEAGADRLINAYAAARLYGKPAIVVDLGTATTFDVVDADGAFVGGAIAPGLELGLDALAARTANLPRVKPDLPERAIGRDTVSAMQSGAVIGYIGLVRELLARIEDEVAPEGDAGATVILTGGLSRAAWVDELLADVIDPSLTLRGLALLHAEVGARPREGSAA